MTLQFNISGLALTLAEGGSYSFTLTPKGQLSAAMDIRWVIVPKGKIPITNNDFSALEGTERFASGATAGKTITITPTDDSKSEVSGEFEIQVYQVVSGGDILIGSQDVVLTDDEAFTGVSTNISLSGNSNVNNFFFGASSPLGAEGVSGNDVYVISRYQTDDVDLRDLFGTNIIKFDYGVEISSARKVGFFGAGTGELLLGTDSSSPTATVTWAGPVNWQYQLGDSDVLSWAEFLTALSLSGNGGALTNAYTVDSLASDTVTGGNVAFVFSGSSADEVFSFGGDGALDAEGVAGDDVYVISRYQTDDVDLRDLFGTNIIKFDYGVEISSARKVGFFGAGTGELLLGTDASNPTATVTWAGPVNWEYQIADGAVLSWTEFLAALGLSSSGGTLSTPYTVEDPPGKIITSDATGTSLPENTEVSTSTAVYTAVGTTADVAGNTIVWSLKTGDDFGLFNINSSTGKVTFATATTPNHEAKSSYRFTIVATVGTGATAETDEQTITIDVTDLNDTTPIFTSGTTATIAEGTAFSTTTAVYTATATPDVDGDTIVWSLSGTDAGLFNIDSTGKVTFATATTPDYESGPTSYRFDVTATVGTGSTAQTATQTVTLSVTNLNEAPIISTNSGNDIALSVLEGTTTQTPIAKIVASDGDGDTLSYSLSGADAADFSIDANGVLKFAASPSYAVPADSGTNNVYNVTVTVSDGTGAGALSDTIALTITILESTESTTAPTISSGATGTFAENTPFDVTKPIYTAAGSAGAAISWSLKAGGDAALFNIDPRTGKVTFKAATTPDFETDPSYTFTVVATTGTLNTEQAVTVTITDVEDPPVLAGDLSGEVKEAGKEPATSAATIFNAHGLIFTFKDIDDVVDDDDKATLGNILNGTLKNFQFATITYTSSFTSTTGEDWIFKIYADGFSHTYTGLLGWLSAGRYGVGSFYTLSFADGIEGTAALPAAWQDGIPIDLASAGGEADTPSTSFTVHGLVFTFKDIDDVADDLDKSLLGKVLNGTLKNFQFATVTYSSSLTITTGEDWIFQLYVDGFAHTYTGLMNHLRAKGSFGVNDIYTLSLADGISSADNALPNNWRDKISIVLESAGGGAGADTPGTPMATGQLSVTDDDVSDAGGFAATDLTLQVLVGSTWTTANTDTANSGAGLKIVGTYGALYLKSDGAWSYVLDNDDPDTQALNPNDAVPETFELRVTDGTAAPSETKTLTITVQGTNDVVLSATASGGTTADGVTAISVAENTQTGNVTTITVTNPDGADLTYSLLGADRNSFTFDEATGILRFTEIPDYEFPTDNGKDNIYNVTVNITDGVFAQNIVLAVTVTDVGTLVRPIITSGAGGSIKENLQYTTNDSIYVAEGSSGSHERILWSLKAGDNAALFDIDPRTGVVTFKTATTLDYESNPFIGSTANDGTPEFRFTIVGTVGNGVLAQSREKNVIIKLENLNDAPEITTNSGNAIALSVAENSPSTTILTTIVVDEEDVGTNLRYGLSGADADDFTINAQGQLQFKAAPNAEAPTDSDADNIYDVTITVQDDVDASGNALDSDSRRFSYDGGVATITDTAAVGHTPAARTLGVTSGSIIKSDGTIYNFAAQTGLSVTADSYIIVDDADNNNSYEVRLVSKASGLPSGNDFYVLGEVEPHTVSNNAGGTRTGTLTINPILSDTIDVTVTITDVDDSPPVLAGNLSGTVTEAGIEVVGEKQVFTHHGLVFTLKDDASAAVKTALESVDDFSFFVGTETATFITTVSGGTDKIWRIVINPDIGTQTYNQLVRYITDTYVGHNDIISAFDLSLTSGIGGTQVPAGIFDKAAFTLTAQPATLATNGDPTATGQLSVTDADVSDAGGFGVADLQVRVGSTWTTANTDAANGGKGLKIVGTYGALYLKSNGAWIYELDNDDPDTEALTPNDAVPETFELRLADGTTAIGVAKNLIITVQGTNDNISFSASASGGTTANGVTTISVAENASTKAVTTITTINPNGLSLTYSLLGGDKDLFNFNSNTGVLSFKTIPDFESPTDVGRNNVYDVAVKIVGSVGGLSTDFALAVKVSITNVYDSPPVFISSSTGAALPENVLADGVVYTAVAKPDIASDTILYLLKAGVGDGDLFDINSNTGAVAFKTAPTPDFETKNSYSFTVIATTRAGTDPQRAEYAVTIPVADRIELPTITTNNGNALAIDVAEATTAVTTIAVADVEAGETLAYSLSGADAALFSINASGVLRFKSAPDFGAPSDVGGDNVYDVTVHVTDGVSYDASGDSTDADTRFFVYTGGTLTRNSNGKLDVAAGEITTQDGRTIDIHAALNRALPEGAYVIAHDMNGNGFYTSRVVTQLPTDTEAYYVLGKEDAFDAYASLTINGVVIVADQVGAAGNDIEIKFLKTAYSQPTIFSTTDGFLVYFSSGGESVSLSEIINAINANSNSRDLVTASLAVDGTGDDEFATTGTNTIVNLAGGSDAYVQPTGDEIDIAVTITDVL